MSDFITGLRSDLVEAAERLERRRLPRAAWPLHPRMWAPTAARAALAAAACAIAVIGALTVFKPSPPQPQRLKAIAVLNLGGVPAWATAAGGSIWIGDQNDGLARIDPRTRAVARIAMGGDGAGLAGGGDTLWAGRNAGGAVTFLRLDPATGRIRARLPARRDVGSIEVAGGALWASNAARATLDRLDPATGRVTARVPDAKSAVLAGSSRALWSLDTNGTLVEIDAATGRVLHRVSRVVPLAMGGADLGGPMVAADATGAWVSDARSGTVTRVERGRVVRRVPVALGASRLALTPGGLWVSYGGGRFGVARVDARTGRITATADLGTDPPRLLVAIGDELWVIGIDGATRVVGTSNRAGA